MKPVQESDRQRTPERARSIKIGLLINPIAGLGGAVGLKGTDGPGLNQKAIDLGAKPRAGERAARALQTMRKHADLFELLTVKGPMGGDFVGTVKIAHELVKLDVGERTSASDTRDAAMVFRKNRVSLILFAGGDGTARDILEAIQDSVPVIGIPCGVKMHSGVFATGPEAAGRLALECIAQFQLHRPGFSTEFFEVMDIDEEAYREGRLNAKLYGYMRCPRGRTRLQGPKVQALASHDEAVRSAAAEIADGMDQESIYLVGPGRSAKAVCESLNIEGTLLGVDAIHNAVVVGADLSMGEIEDLCRNRRVFIILGVVGGQGFVLGRGNQQIPPSIIRKAGRDRIIVLSSEEKLANLRGGRLLVDTGSARLDADLEGYIRVHTGLNRRIVMRLSAAL